MRPDLARAGTLRPRPGGAANSHEAGAHRPSLVGVVVAGLASVVAVLAATWLTAPAPASGLVLPGPVVAAGLPVARVVLDLAAVATMGLSLLPILVGFRRPAHVEQLLRLARRAALVTAAVWATAAVISLVLQAAEIRPGEPVTASDVLGYVSEFGAGQALMVIAAVAVLYLLVGAVSARFGDKVPAEVRVGIVGLGLLPLTVAGHAGSLASQWHDLMMISVELHVLAASAWAGGLAAMLILVMPRRGLLASAWPRFSQLAGLCLVIVGTSGVITAAAELAITPGIQLPGAVLTSHYGQLVLVKTAVVAALAALGSQIRYRL
ncbi:MAG: copper resistance protein CopD, partial [Pseudonocardia sp.]|nr:copper resistance protein CopD [Pseudonocardia sp.]